MKINPYRIACMSCGSDMIMIPCFKYSGDKLVIDRENNVHENGTTKWVEYYCSVCCLNEYNNAAIMIYVKDEIQNGAKK